MIEKILIIILAIGVITLSFDYILDIWYKAHEGIKNWWESLQNESTTVSSTAKLSMLQGVEFHLRELLQLTYGIGNQRGLNLFALISALLCAVAITVLSNKIDALLVTITGLIFGILPYIFLRLRLGNLRVRASKEGEILISELLENYKINHKNIREALEYTAVTIEDAPNSKRLLMNLIKGLNRAGGADEIRILTDRMARSIDTSWGKILCVNIYFSLAYGVEITESLTDLARGMIHCRKIREYAKRENQEGILMIKYLVPITFLLTIAGGMWYFQLPVRVFFAYQFETEAGLTWFTISLVLYLTGVMACGFISSSKMDF